MPTVSSLKNNDENTLSAQEASQRFLKLLEKIRSTDELTPKLIEDTMGTKGVSRLNKPNDYDFIGHLNNNSWVYHIVLFIDPSSDDERKKLYFEFIPTTKKDSSPQTISAGCFVTLESYHKQFLANGFRYLGDSQYRGTSRQYSRDNLNILVQYKIQNNVEHECVTRIDVR
ncbi:hypothetical protein [Neisseria sp. Ec49-e6-T10]|uniref:hypothetical protein n=1 Tax=Neisseria sp. Ec49-e6-T10 TaxID=3140744 RepID=UPI003EBE0829